MRSTVAAMVLLAIPAACSDPGSSSPGTGHGPLSNEDYAAAVRIARQEIDDLHATISSATATVDRENVGETNTKHRCTSGTVLTVKLIGSFPGTVTTGHPVLPGQPVPDFTVRAAIIKADEATGVPCLIGVQTAENGEPQPLTHSSVLDLSR